MVTDNLHSNQIIKWKQTYNLSLLKLILSNFKKKNLNLNQDSNSDLHISSMALYHWAILVQLPVYPQTFFLKLYLCKKAKLVR